MSQACIGEGAEPSLVTPILPPSTFTNENFHFLVSDFFSLILYSEAASIY
jgi:hypothetical protein